MESIFQSFDFRLRQKQILKHFRYRTPLSKHSEDTEIMLP